MKPEIVLLAGPQNPYARQWADAVQGDVDAGLLPSWIGAVLISVFHDGTARLTYVRQDTWLAAKMQRWIESQ